jgi:hypothetical protein
MGTWTKAQKAEWQLRKDEALAELSALKLHAALIGTDMDKAVALQSLLTSKDMKDGLTSKFPETKAAYQALRDEAITSLQQLASQGGPAAKTAASAVAKFLDPHNPLSPLHDAATWGYYTGTAFGDAIARGIAHAQYLVKASLKGMQALLLASSPPGPESPLHEIDVWGERTGRAWLDPLVGVIRGASSALRPGLADAGRMLMTPMGSAGLQLAAAGAGVGLGGFSRNVPPPGQVLTGHTGPLIGELNVDARGHPDAAGVGAAVKQAVGDAMADVFRDQAARGLTGVKL